MKELTGADRPLSCHGKAVDDERSGLREGIPKIPKLRSRDLKVFGAIEIEYHQYLPGEIQTFPFKGPVVNLHLSAPHRMVQRQNGRRRSGLVATKDAAITPADMPGYWRTDAASEDMSMFLEESFIRRVAAEADGEPEGIEVVPLFSTPEPQIERSGLSLLSEIDGGGLGGELCAESLATVLTLHLLRHHFSLGRRSRRKTECGSDISKRAVERATDCINDNLPGKLTLAEMAGVAHVSPYHFARSFKAETGLSPHQYVIHSASSGRRPCSPIPTSPPPRLPKRWASPTRATSPSTSGACSASLRKRCAGRALASGPDSVEQSKILLERARSC
jgi:AraC family transcriptional regulator